MKYYVMDAFAEKVNEDPVCGSMYCSLIPLWSKRLGKLLYTQSRIFLSNNEQREEKS